MKPPRTSTASPHEEQDGAYTVRQFATRHAISRAQAYLEIKAGRLTARKVGARTIITREDAARWRRALPKIAGKEASNAREPNGLPVWLTNPKPERLPRRRVQQKASKAAALERDVSK